MSTEAPPKKQVRGLKMLRSHPNGPLQQCGNCKKTRRSTCNCLHKGQHPNPPCVLVPKDLELIARRRDVLAPK